MQHNSTELTVDIRSRGGRVASAQYRESIQRSESFTGLEAETSRYDLLLLVKRVGKAAGFTSKMIFLLDHYLSFTRDTDWEEGGRPIVYQSLTKTALDLGVSERQIQRLEAALFQAGALTWCDSGNHKRFGQRCPKTGTILFGFGVDLSPLAYLKPELEAKLHEKKLYQGAWMETKRQVSWYRAQICAVVAETEQEGLTDGWINDAKLAYQRVAVPIRAYMKLEALRGLLGEHKRLYNQILERAGITVEGGELAQKRAPTDDKTVAHKELTNQDQTDKSVTGRRAANCFQESEGQRSSACRRRGVASATPQPNEPTGNRKEELILSTGLQHITLKQALNAATERFRAHIPMQPRPMNWDDLVEAAYRLKPHLHISQESWGDACVILGRNGAAICLLLTDHATARETNPVRKPAGYFKALQQRAKTGELRLHQAVFGILTREADQC